MRYLAIALVLALGACDMTPAQRAALASQYHYRPMYIPTQPVFVQSSPLMTNCTNFGATIQCQSF